MRIKDLIIHYLEKQLMAKFDTVNAKLDELAAAVKDLKAAPATDDSADVKALEDKVDGILADVKGDKKADAPVVHSTDPTPDLTVSPGA